jgi:hypothetical protein
MTLFDNDAAEDITLANSFGASLGAGLSRYRSASASAKLPIRAWACDTASSQLN